MTEQKSPSEKKEGRTRIHTAPHNAGGRVFKGTVVKSAMKDTATVAIESFIKHKKYGKYLCREKKFLVHDAGNTAQVGDIVLIKEVRPISKNKHFVLFETVTGTTTSNDYI